MKKTMLSLLIVLSLMTVVVTRASGPILVYAIVEKVVLEPNESAPERAQIVGAFSIRDKNDKYSAAQRGYLYYKMDSAFCRGASEKQCVADVEKRTRAMWNDLKKKAGSGQAVGFGGGFDENAAAKVRKVTDKPTSPDSFNIGNPVIELGAAQADITAKLKAALKSE